MKKFILAAILLAACGIATLRWDAYRLDVLSIELSEVYRAYWHYVCDNSGRLPPDLAALVRDGCLRERLTERGVQYFGPPVREQEIIPVYDRNPIRQLNGLELRYSGSISELEIRDGRVYVIGTDEEVVFVRASRAALLKHSRKYTREILRKYADR